MPPRSSRKQEILQALAHMLEHNPGSRITTARLAEEVGVSEAALYRHFPSKAKMFEGLIAFTEESIFGLISKIIETEPQGIRQCEKILSLLLGFAEKNPGISRILGGDALVGEHERLRARIAQFYARLETQLKQILREAELKEGLRTRVPVATAANLLMACAEGRISQFLRNDYQQSPLAEWEDQWRILSDAIIQ